MNEIAQKVIKEIQLFIKDEEPKFLSDFDRIYQSMKHERELFFWFSSGDRKMRFEGISKYDDLLTDLYFSIL